MQPSEHPWHINLMGTVRAERAGVPLERLPTRKTWALLAYLAYYADREHPREFLTEIFWPDSDPNAGRKSLSVALSALRRELEPHGVPEGSVLVTDRHSVRLNPAAVRTDVAVFEAALNTAGSAAPEARRELLRKALRLYHPPLLPGFYEDWIPAQQERLASLFDRGAADLVALLEQAGEWDEAITWARRALAEDPLREEWHTRLIRLLAATGQPSAALRQYGELERILRSELDASPSPETRDLAASIRSGTASSSVRPPTASPVPPPVAVPVEPALTPHPLTRFFGREEELEALLKLVRSGRTVNGGGKWKPRMVTVTGPGGSGKTRLVQELIHRYRDQFPVIVAFVSFSDLSDTTLVPNAVAAALGFPPPSRDCVPEQLAQALGDREALLVLDNLEHMGEVCVGLLKRALEFAPGLTILGTSRRRLNVPGEQAFPLQPLPVPSGENAASPELLSDLASVQLFLDRAGAVRPDFRLTEENAAAVAEVCRRLEGIPLAVELAAARIGVVTPGQMLTYLDRPLAFLTSHEDAVPPRHRSLEAAIAWSYELLPERLRHAFARLSVFRSGCTLPAASAVMNGDPGSPTALDALQQLRECSLVLAEERATPEGPRMRFRILEPLREFGVERLEPEESREARHRHAAWCLDLALEALDHLRGEDQALWFDRLDAEHENLRAALSWFLETDPPRALHLAASLTQFWFMKGHFREGQRWMHAALEAAPDAEPDLRSWALMGAGHMASIQGTPEQARELLREALDLARGAENHRVAAHSLNGLANLAMMGNDLGGGVSLYEEALGIFEQIGDATGVWTARVNLALAMERRGDRDGARRLLEASLENRRACGDRRGEAACLVNLGHISLIEGDLSRAGALFTDGLIANREIGARVAATVCLTGVAAVCAGRGRWEEAAVLYGAIDTLRNELGCPFWGEDRDDFNRDTDAARAALGEGEFDRAWRRGCRFSHEEAERFAINAAASGRAAQAARR